MFKVIFESRVIRFSLLFFVLALGAIGISFYTLKPLAPPLTAIVSQNLGPLILPPAGSWAAFPNSTLRPAMGSAPWNPAFIFSYSGGWFDEKRNELGVWGGGHADYPGNEVCTFPLSTGVWTCGPRSAYVQDPTTETTADGNPSSRHTYSCIARVKAPGYDGFFCHGGSLWPAGLGTAASWVYHRGRATWGRLPDRP